MIPTVTKEKDDEVEVQPQVQHFQDTNILPFPRRDRKLKMDAQLVGLLRLFKNYISTSLC
jgi:hypothetical protein